MRIIIARHGDPDYSIDSLTEKGWREAGLLAKRLALSANGTEGNVYAYVSPLGRAKDTASLSLKRLGITAKEQPWMREFHSPVKDPFTGRERLCWDFIPEYWMNLPGYFDKDEWHKVSVMGEGKVIAEAERVWNGLDEILSSHGYEREGCYYRAVSPNRDTILLFCHFGVECVMLSHLLNISPMILWHCFFAAPSAVTVLYTEERRKGIASFRMTCFGDRAAFS